jgi:hemerythrin superfamily protein
MADVLTMLQTDHRVVERLLDVLADSEPGAERDTAVAELAASLSLHMQFEETEIYPLLAAVDAEMEQEAENEHRLAREGLAKLQELAGEPGFGAAVEMLKGGITHHVEDEEGEVFPTLRAECDASQLQQLAGRLLEAKRTAGVLESELGQLTKEQLLEVAGQLDISGRSNMSRDDLAAAIAGS